MLAHQYYLSVLYSIDYHKYSIFHDQVLSDEIFGTHQKNAHLQIHTKRLV